MSKGKILFVEADRDYSQMIDLFFTGQGYEVEVLVDRTNTIERIVETPPDIVILATNAPDAYEDSAYQTIRANPLTIDIAVLLLHDCSKHERSFVWRDLQLSGDIVVEKPFDIYELKILLEQAIKHKK